MAAQIQCKSTKQDVKKFLAHWNIHNFGTLYPCPAVGYKSANIANANSKAQTQAATGTTGIDDQIRNYPPEVKSPHFIFKTGHKSSMSADMSLLISNEKEKHDEDAAESDTPVQGYNLKLQLSVRVTKDLTDPSRTLKRLKFQIDLLNTDGNVVSTPKPATMTWLVKRQKNGQPPVYIIGSLLNMWEHEKEFFADDTLRVQLSLTLLGEFLHEDEGMDNDRVDKMDKKDGFFKRFKEAMTKFQNLGKPEHHNG